MKYLQFASRGGVLLVLAVAISSAACSKSTTAPTEPEPPTAGSAITYSAVGASDVTGQGSSVVCLPFLNCDGNGYVYVAARQLRAQGFPVDATPLGIPGAVISRGFLDLALQYGRNDVVANMTQSLVPFIASKTTLVSVFAGANDVNVITTALGLGAGGGNPAAFIDEKITAFGADYATLLAGVRGRAPGARIVIFNLPNLAALPYLAAAPLAQKQAAQRAAVGFTAKINALPDIVVIDLMCDARFYQPGTFSSDGFHPGDAGYVTMAGELVKAATGAYPAPRSSCSQMTLF